MALRLRPDLEIVNLRGNVHTRLRRIEEGVAHATLLAAAGLTRLGLLDQAASLIEPGEWLPAVGQGIIAITMRTGDAATAERLAAIDDHDSSVALTSERAFLDVLDGSCRTPIGGFAELADGGIRFRGIIVSPDGARAHATERRGSVGRGRAPRRRRRRGAARARRTGLFRRHLTCACSCSDPSRMRARPRRACAALGHSVLVEPMLTVEFRPEPADSARAGGDPPHQPQRRAGARPLAADGRLARSSRPLPSGRRRPRLPGLPDSPSVHVGSRDAAALAELVAAVLPPAAGTLLYPAARDRAGDLAGRLSDGGFSVQVAIRNEARRPPATTASIARAAH